MLFNVKMYRLKADGKAYSKAHRSLRAVSISDMAAAANEVPWPSIFVNVENDTIVLHSEKTEEEPVEEPVEEPAAPAKGKSTKASREDLERRIEALMALADSTTIEEEAQAFYAKAEQLMLKHAIDRAKVESRKGKKDTAREEVTSIEIPFPHVRERWKSLGVSGSSAISEAIGLTGVAINNRTFTVVLYGRKSDCEHVRKIITAAWRQAEAFLKTWRKSSDTYKAARECGETTGNWGEYYRSLDGYVFGFAEGVAEKVRVARDEYVASTGSELVLRTIKDDILRALDGLSKSRMRSFSISNLARAEGQMDGASANLAEEVSK